LPNWLDIAEIFKVNKNGLTSLEIFIHNNEPAGRQDSRQFRRELISVLNSQTEEIHWEENP